MNQLTITGNLTADPESRFTPSGAQVTAFGVAVNKRWKSKDGQPQEKVTFFRVSAWNSLAEVCEKYLVKGSKVLVVGEMEPARGYKRQDGEIGASLEVTANSVEFLTPLNNDGAAPPAQRGQGAATKPPQPMDTVPTPAKEPDIAW